LSGKTGKLYLVDLAGS